MKEINLSSIKDKLIIGLLSILLIALSAILIVLIYKIFHKKNEIEPLNESDKNLEEKKSHNKEKKINPAIEASEVMNYVLRNINLNKHCSNNSTRYIYLSNQIANIFNLEESEYGNFRKSIYFSSIAKNSRMLMTEEVKTIASFIDQGYEQIEIGSVDVVRKIADLDIIEKNGKTKKQNYEEKIKNQNEAWKQEYKRIKKENNDEQKKIDKENKELEQRINSENAKLIENYKKNNLQIFQEENGDQILNESQIQNKTKKVFQQRSPKTIWEKFLNVFGLFNSSIEIKDENMNLKPQNIKNKNNNDENNIDFAKIPGYVIFTPKTANLTALPEKPSDENSPLLLGNQLQGQYILHKRIYECIKDGKESKLVIRVPGHYYHIKIERKDQSNLGNKEVNVIISDSGDQGQLIQNHIEDIRKNGIQFIDYSKGYFDRDINGNVIGDMKYPEITLDNNQIAINIIQDSCAKQNGGYECGLFSIYNGNKELFNEVGVNFETKTSYNDFNQKLHSTIYLLFRASLIYGYFESNILWNLKNKNSDLNLNEFHEEILNETKNLCKNFIENINTKKPTIDEWNNGLIQFDEAFFNMVKNKINEKFKENIEKLDDGELNVGIKDILKINFINNTKETSPDSSIIASEDGVQNLDTQTFSTKT
jgi:hypothetical protein